MSTSDRFFTRLAAEQAVLVTVRSARGSVPREAGAWMAVFGHGAVGTIGGGHLELAAMRQARECLRGAPAQTLQRYALGPALGQCCGGSVQLRFEPVRASDLAMLRVRLQPRRWPLALFGAGHVGHALVRLVQELPLLVRWFDSRDEIFPAELPDNVSCEQSSPVQAEVAGLAPDSRVLIMSFSHAEDLELVAACLARQRQRADLPYVGLIGSQTKWARFRTRLAARGFTAQEMAHITCPIGVAGIAGKQPEVIAVSAAAQLLQTLPPLDPGASA